jgi:hypothetical protein
MTNLYSKKQFLGKLRNLLNLPYQIQGFKDEIRSFQSRVLFDETKRIQASSKNPLNHCGKKCFSQTDEDGITLEIVRRLGISDAGVYVEFGVGDGTENNTLILAALGWKGVWVGNEALAWDINKADKSQFAYIQGWITLENVTQSIERGLSQVESRVVDVISFDLDGNDIYLVENILKSGIRPKLFIVEYNAKFPPPVRFQIEYDPQHKWLGDDYFGASLSSFQDLFARHGYQLVCCNSHTGSNAFFIDQQFLNYFHDVPKDVAGLYIEPRYFLYPDYGHPRSIKTIERIFADSVPKNVKKTA